MSKSLCCLRHLPVIIIVFLILAFSSSIITTFDKSGELGDLDLYKIAWKGPLTTEKFNEDYVINISTKHKEKYKCLVPGNVDQLSFDTSARNSSSDEQNKSPYKVLEPLLKSNYCSYKIELFWVYELCHGKFLRQYHEETSKHRSKITQEYYLGSMIGKEDAQIKAHELEEEKEQAIRDRAGLSRPTILVNGYHKPYLTINMTDGTRCDLTKRPRVSKIIYVCNEEPKHELYSLKEISTCEYEAIVLSPLLCLHKDFKVDTNTQHEIQCYSLDGSPRIPMKSIDHDDDQEGQEDEHKNSGREKGVAYFQGKTLIIDADLIQLIE